MNDFSITRQDFSGDDDRVRIKKGAIGALGAQWP